MNLTEHTVVAPPAIDGNEDAAVQAEDGNGAGVGDAQAENAGAGAVTNTGTSPDPKDPTPVPRQQAPLAAAGGDTPTNRAVCRSATPKANSATSPGNDLKPKQGSNQHDNTSHPDPNSHSKQKIPTSEAEPRPTHEAAYGGGSKPLMLQANPKTSNVADADAATGKSQSAHASADPALAGAEAKKTQKEKAKVDGEGEDEAEMKGITIPTPKGDVTISGIGGGGLKLE